MTEVTGGLAIVCTCIYITKKRLGIMAGDVRAGGVAKFGGPLSASHVWVRRKEFDTFDKCLKKCLCQISRAGNTEIKCLSFFPSFLLLCHVICERV